MDKWILYHENQEDVSVFSSCTGARALSSAVLNQTNGIIWRLTANCGVGFSQSCTPQDWASIGCTHSQDAVVACPGVCLCGNAYL